MNTQQETKRRGRPSGSTSFVRINISDLLNAVGQNSRVGVSEKWLEEIGLTLESPAPKLIALQPEAPKEQPKIEFSVTSF